VPPFTGVPLQAPELDRGTNGLDENVEVEEVDLDLDDLVDAADEATLGATANAATSDTEPSDMAASLNIFPCLD
jgi:hypothetical protein